MKVVAAVFLAALIFGSSALSHDKPERAPLLLVQEIPLPNVGGRIDHSSFDAKRKRVIGAALGNNTVEIVDTFSGRDIHSIIGAAAPQGVVYVGEIDRLFVANGTDGKLRIYDGDSFKLLNTVEIGEDADNVRYDPKEKRVYVAYGGDEEGGIAVIDAATDKRLDDVAKLDAHPRIIPNQQLEAGDLRQHRHQSQTRRDRPHHPQSHRLAVKDWQVELSDGIG